MVVATYHRLSDLHTHNTNMFTPLLRQHAKARKRHALVTFSPTNLSLDNFSTTRKQVFFYPASSRKLRVQKHVGSYLPETYLARDRQSHRKRRRLVVKSHDVREHTNTRSLRGATNLPTCPAALRAESRSYGKPERPKRAFRVVISLGRK